MKTKIEVKLVKSCIGRPSRQRETVKGLGLRKINQVRVLENTPAVVGMVKKVGHLVEWKEV